MDFLSGGPWHLIRVHIANQLYARKIIVVQRHEREAAGKKWKDTSLLEWPENDYRLFVGNLDKETRLDQLEKAFKHYPSFTMAKLVMNKVPEPNSTVYKCKGYGFTSFMDPMDCAKALRLEQGKYCGLRPMQLKRSKWEERNKSSRDEERRRGRS